MTTDEILTKAKLLCVMHPNEKLTNDRFEFSKSHKSLIIKTMDQYSNWNFPKNCILSGLPLNEHHLTTNFLFKTLLPNLAVLLNFEIDWSKYKYVSNIYTDADGRSFDLSTYEPINQGEYNVWCNDINNGIFGNFEVLKYSSYISIWYAKGLFQKQFPCIESLSPYHKLYAFPHTNSKILNLTKNNNGRTLLISCDSQMIPIIPFLATIYKEVWILDNRDKNASTCHPWIDDVKFDDVLIAAPLLPGTDPCPPLERFTVNNFA